jgi:hypothetical protein
VVAFIIIALVTISRRSNSSWRSGRRRTSGTVGPIRPTGASPLVRVNTGHAAKTNPKERRKDRHRGQAWIAFAIAVVVAVFVAGLSWWGGGNHPYSVNQANRNGYFAGTQGNHSNGHTAVPGGQGDANNGAPPPADANGQQLAARPIWA